MDYLGGTDLIILALKSRAFLQLKQKRAMARSCQVLSMKRIQHTITGSEILESMCKDQRKVSRSCGWLPNHSHQGNRDLSRVTTRK